MTYLLGSGVEKMLTRRAYIQVIYQDTDISKYINLDLLSFSYTDNASGSADDVSIELNDAKRKWISKWVFEQGDIFQVDIVTLNWRKNDEQKRLPCGIFMVDEPEYSGRPSVITLNGISTPANSNFMHTKRNKEWKNISLKGLSTEIANRYGLELFYDSKKNPTFKNRSQSDETDAGFLQETCEDTGFAFKVTDNKIIIFNEQEYESKKEVATFHENESTVLDYSFKPTLTNTAYSGVSLKYFDAKTNRNIEYLFALKEIDEEDKVYQLNRRVGSLSEAKQLAQSTLRKLNKKQVTATLNLVGDTRLLASSTIMLKGFGSFSGKYYIDKATHGLSSYTTSLELHKVLGGGY